VIEGDIISIPEPDASFDVIMCNEVLEHLPDPVKAIHEFSRLLKPGGRIILTAPFCSLTHFAPYHFSSGFNSYWYQTHLVEHDFIDLKIERSGTYFSYLAQEMFRIPSISKRYCQKPPRLIEMIALFIVVKMLARFNKRDEGSSEILCYGYHVTAQKKSKK